MTCLHFHLLRRWNERTDEPAVNVVVVEEEDVEQFELPLIGDVKRDCGEFIVGERLTVQQLGQLLNLLEEYKDRFAKRVGRTDIVNHKIRLKEGVPYTRQMYATPDSLQNEVDRQIAELLEQGMIEESDSPYAAQIVFVKKRNGKIRLTCDYKTINLMTVDNAYGMADRTELIERAAKAKYVSTIDMASAYWQVPMSSERKSLTCCRTRRGLFKWNVMPRD